MSDQDVQEEFRDAERDNLYDFLREFDLLDVIEKEDGGRFLVLPNGKIKLQTMQPIDHPWLHSHHRSGQRCDLWLGVYFKLFGILPSYCKQCCWKVCATKHFDGSQLTFDEIMKIHKAQETMGHPSKCGFDRRPYTSNIYAAFWYCQGEVHARSVLNDVSAMLRTINPEINVFIKRGCTEMEMEFGRSCDWDTVPRLELESYLDYFITTDLWVHQQSQLQQRHVVHKMFHWAHEHGDMTYTKYSGGYFVKGAASVPCTY